MPQIIQEYVIGHTPPLKHRSRRPRRQTSHKPPLRTAARTEGSDQLRVFMVGVALNQKPPQGKGFLVSAVRLELTTNGLKGHCSAGLSYAPEANSILSCSFSYVNKNNAILSICAVCGATSKGVTFFSVYPPLISFFASRAKMDGSRET